MIRSKLLMVRPVAFDWDKQRAEIEGIARDLGVYLAQTGGRGGGAGSKHRELGAVGKALQHARTVRGDALLGYARRVHEQTTQSKFPAGPVEKLDEGLRKLDKLLAKAPRNAVGLILDRIGYATYYDVKRRFVDFQGDWLKYLEQNAPRLKLTDFDPRKPVWFSQKKLEERGAGWKQARDEFLASRRELLALEDDPEEDTGD
jgi:hypothetical protein